MSSFSPAEEEPRTFEARSFREPETFHAAETEEVAVERPVAAEPEPTGTGGEADGAWQAGFAAAREETERETAAHFAPVLEALTRSAEALDRQRREYLAAHRDALVELALAVAERVVGEELSQRPAHLARWVDEAIAELGKVDDRGTVRVHLAPDDLAWIHSHPPEPGLPLEWVEDARLSRGEARVEQGASAVGVGIRAAIGEVRRVLTADARVEEAPE